MTTHSDTTEEQFAKKLRQQLESSTGQITPAIAQRLFEARSAALARHTDTIAPARHGWSTAIALSLPKAKVLLMAIALLAGIAITYYWNVFEEAQRHGEIDSEMLADELPPSAHIDQGFRTWLERASSDSAPQ